MINSRKLEKKIQYVERISSAWSEDSIRLINTPSIATRNTFFYVQETGYFKTQPPYFTERANLHSFLIVYTLSGHGTLRYNGSSYTLSANQIFFIDCRAHHYYECVNNDGWEMLWLHFNGNGALGYYETFAKSALPVLTFGDSFFMESSLRRIVSLTAKKDVHSDILCSNIIINVVTHLLICSSNENLSLSAMPQYLKYIGKYLEQHFKELISLDALSMDCDVSKYHLSREFKKYFGRTLTDYLIELRLNYAKELLRFSDLPISEITFACGMNNTSHFIRLFKRQEGRTPLAYRKEWTS